MPNKDRNTSSLTHNYRHTRGAPPPYRKAPGLGKLILIVVGVLFGAYVIVGGIASAFKSTPVSTEAPTVTLTQPALPSGTSAPTRTPKPTFTLTPKPTFTLTPEPSLTPTITLPAFSSANCINQQSERVEAQVVRITDGDTIVVSIEGQEYKVRYIGVDSPEVGSNYSSQATTYNTQLLAGGVVVLIKDASETDRYDRLLRYVIAGEKFVNYEMVKAGYAHSGSWPPDTACDSTFAAAEKASKLSQLGMWVPIPVVAPTKLALVNIPTLSPTQPKVASGCPNGCTSSSSTCVIKGNIASDGDKIYHMPGQAYYDKTVISPEKGERWFCTEAEALANGWRKSLR